MDIFELLKQNGIEVPADKEESINKELRKAYKHIDEVQGYKDAVKTAEDKLAAANSKIDELSKLDIDGVKREAADWKTKFETAQQEAQKQASALAELEYDALVKEHVAGKKFTSNAAKAEFIRQIKAKGLKSENGKLLGFDDYVKEYAEQDPGVFANDDNSQGAGQFRVDMAAPHTNNQPAHTGGAAINDAIRAAAGIKT